MAIAITLREFLDTHHLPYETLRHTHTQSSGETVTASHQKASRIAKAVLLKNSDDFLLAVVPADHRVHFGQLHHELDQQLGLATESEVASVFSDCETGAIPPAGLLYGVDTLVDDALLDQPDIYFEAGDHEQLIHMKQADFRKLLGDAKHQYFSVHR